MTTPTKLFPYIIERAMLTMTIQSMKASRSDPRIDLSDSKEGDFFVFDNNSGKDVFGGTSWQEFSKVDPVESEQGMDEASARLWCEYFNEHINTEHGYRVIDSDELYTLKMMDSL